MELANGGLRQLRSGSGGRPGAEEWVVTPLGVVRFGRRSFRSIALAKEGAGERRAGRRRSCGLAPGVVGCRGDDGGLAAPPYGPERDGPASTGGELRLTAACLRARPPSSRRGGALRVWSGCVAFATRRVTCDRAVGARVRAAGGGDGPPGDGAGAVQQVTTPPTFAARGGARRRRAAGGRTARLLPCGRSARRPLQGPDANWRIAPPVFALILMRRLSPSVLTRLPAEPGDVPSLRRAAGEWPSFAARPWAQVQESVVVLAPR